MECYTASQQPYDNNYYEQVISYDHSGDHKMSPDFYNAQWAEQKYTVAQNSQNFEELCSNDVDNNWVAQSYMPTESDVSSAGECGVQKRAKAC